MAKPINEVLGTSGPDELSGTVGIDNMFGLGGNDTFLWSAGADFIDGGDGIDTVDYSASPHGVYIDMFFTVVPFVQAQNINKGVHTGSGVPASEHGQGTPPPQKNTGQDTLVNVEIIVGSEHSDTLIGVEGGTFGEGEFTTNGTTALFGMGGNDSIQTLPGGFADTDEEVLLLDLIITMDGGEGNDLIFATGFIDLPGPQDNLNPLDALSIILHPTMIGGAGDDVLVADIAQPDSLFDMTGGDGADTFQILLQGSEDEDGDGDGNPVAPTTGLFNGYAVVINDFILEEGDTLIFDDFPFSGPDFNPAKLAGVGGPAVDTDPVTTAEDLINAVDIFGNNVEGDLTLTFNNGSTLTFVGYDANDFGNAGAFLTSIGLTDDSFVSGPDTIPNNVNAG